MKKFWQLLVIVSCILIIFGPPAWAFGSLIINGSWPIWTGFGEYFGPNGEYERSKTLWDLWKLLIIPIALAVIAYFFNREERKTEQEIATDHLQEAALETYFDRITELLLENGLDTVDEYSELSNTRARDIARARTLTVFRKLNGERKGLLVRFLYQAKLIRTDKIVIDLSGADLSNANLSGTDLSKNRDRTYLSYLSLAEVHLAGANLANANLTEAKLSQANLMFTDLSYADLSDANLISADLRGATLTGTKFHNTNLLMANLSGATGVTKKQLAQAIKTIGVIMPDGTEHE